LKIPVDKIVYINMDRAIIRKRNLLAHFKDINLLDKNGDEPIRVRGVDGNLVNHTVIPKKSIGEKGLPLSVSEKGCYASHRSVMLMQLMNKWDKVLYLEDDVRFNPSKLHTLVNNWESMPEFDMLNLSWNYYKRPSPQTLEPVDYPGLNHFYKGDGMWLCHAYIFTLEGAKIAEDYTKVQTHGLDWHYSAMQTNIRSYGFKWGEIATQDNKGSGMKSQIIHTS
jgi:GR25 family glycosyltransferase involved in LPS biosynthesis